MFGDRSQRTERPTSKRLEKARRDGNVPRSKELPGALVLLAFVAFCHFAGRGWLGRVEGLFATSLGRLARPELTEATVSALTGSLLATTAGLLLLPLGVVAAAGIAGNLLQGPPPFTLQPLTPKWSRLDPVKGLQKVVRLKSWMEALKSALKMGLFTAIALYAIRDAMTEGLPGAPGAEGAMASLVFVGGKVTFRIGLVVLALAVLDVLFTRYDHVRQLRMTKQEVEDERKEAEGDPLIRARIKSKQMQLARSRMMADVRRATVVVTNPTHFAVALRWVPGEMEAPLCLAKGRGEIARRIREVAAEHRIPIIEDAPLARALYRLAQIGGSVPPQLYRAVAEVLALVLRGRRNGRRPPRRPIGEEA